MAKINALYTINLQADIPDDVFYAIIKIFKNERDFSCRNILNLMIAKYSDEWKKLPLNASLEGVYNYILGYDENNELIFSQPEDEEVYWEA